MGLRLLHEEPSGSSASPRGHLGPWCRTRGKRRGKGGPSPAVGKVLGVPCPPHAPLARNLLLVSAARALIGRGLCSRVLIGASKCSSPRAPTPSRRALGPPTSKVGGAAASGQSRAPGRVTLGPRRRRRHFGPPRPRPSTRCLLESCSVFSCSAGRGTVSPVSSERPGRGGACRALGASRAGVGAVVTSPRTPLRPGGGWHPDLALPPRPGAPGISAAPRWFRRMRIGVRSAHLWRLEPRGQRGHRTRHSQPATWAGGPAQFENAAEPCGGQKEDRGCPTPAAPR